MNEEAMKEGRSPPTREDGPPSLDDGVRALEDL
jgi:hypothetical protein